MNDTQALALIQGQSPRSEVEPFEIAPLGLRVHGRPTLKQWIEFGRKLWGIRRALQWTIGDWLNYGESRTDWGEKYAQALDEMDFDYGYLRNMASVAQKFDLSRRRDKLSWSHHQAVAALPAPEQDTWLKRAEADHWTRGYLRGQIKPDPDPTPTSAAGNGSETNGESAMPTEQSASEPPVEGGACSQSEFPISDGTVTNGLCFRGEFTVHSVNSKYPMVVLFVQPDLWQALGQGQKGNYVVTIEQGVEA